MLNQYTPGYLSPELLKRLRDCLNPPEEPVCTPPPSPQPSALETQIAGDHYKKLGAYQPWEVLARCMTPDELRGYGKGTAIAYLLRERAKGGFTDIVKARHTLQLLEELLPVCEKFHASLSE